MEENITQAEGVGPRGLGGQHESLIARYYFPKSIVHVIASWSAKADRFGGVTRSEEVTVVVFDRGWIESRLCEHVTRFREVVEWARNFVVEVDSGVLKMDGLPPFPGATPTHKQRSTISQFEDAQLLGVNNKPFVVVSRALEDLRDQPAGTISLAINFMVNPGGVTDVIYEYSGTEVNCCNSLVAQRSFPLVARRLTPQKAATATTRAILGAQVMVGKSRLRRPACSTSITYLKRTCDC